MANYFIFNEIDSRDIPGLIVATLPPISRPPQRVETIEIDGRDGDITIKQGYKAYNKKIGIYLDDLSALDTVMNWIKGEGNLIISSEPDKYYKAKVIDGIDFERFATLRNGDIIFHVQPYKYDVNETNITASSTQLADKSLTLANIGNEKAKPLLHLTGSGTVTVSLNGSSVFSYTFPSGDTEVYIDSEEQDAYLSTTLKNRNMNGEFAELLTGSNTITWTGTLTGLVITPRSRWL